MLWARVHLTVRESCTRCRHWGEKGEPLVIIISKGYQKLPSWAIFPVNSMLHGCICPKSCLHDMSIIVSPDESRGYCAFVIVMPPPQRFIVCALQPAVFVQSFSNSGHMSLAPRSRCQSILGTLGFHLWPLGGQIPFSCGCSWDLSFQPIFFLFAPNVLWTKI